MNSALDIFRDLYRHMQWADAEIWRVLRATPALLEDARLLKLVRHIHSTEHAFLRMWTGVPIEKGMFGHRDPDALQQFAREFYASADDFLASVDAERLNDIIDMPWLAEFATIVGRPLERPTLAETLTQLPMHGNYHRGQANLRIREAGGEPPLIDYIAWVWFGRPEPQWP